MPSKRRPPANGKLSQMPCPGGFNAILWLHGRTAAELRRAAMVYAPANNASPLHRDAPLIVVWRGQRSTVHAGLSGMVKTPAAEQCAKPAAARWASSRGRAGQWKRAAI